MFIAPELLERTSPVGSGDATSDRRKDISRVLDYKHFVPPGRGGLSSAEQELFDSEYELSKAGYAANEVNDALAFQKLKNEIIASQDKWDEYAKARATAKDKKWFRHPGIDVRGPERRDDPFWTHMRRFYVYDPLPTLQTLNAPLLAVFGDLDTPEGVKANVRAIRQILDQAARRITPLRFTQTPR